MKSNFAPESFYAVLPNGSTKALKSMWWKGALAEARKHYNTSDVKTSGELAGVPASWR